MERLFAFAYAAVGLGITATAVWMIADSASSPYLRWFDALPFAAMEMTLAFVCFVRSWLMWQDGQRGQ